MEDKTKVLYVAKFDGECFFNRMFKSQYEYTSNTINWIRIKVLIYV